MGCVAGRRRTARRIAVGGSTNTEGPALAGLDLTPTAPLDEDQERVVSVAFTKHGQPRRPGPRRLETAALATQPATTSAAECTRQNERGCRPAHGQRPKIAVNTRRVLSERRRRFPQVLQDDEGGLRKAPDNRHEDGDERALRRRSSESRWPRVMRWRPARAQRSVDRGARGPAIEPRKLHCPGRRRGRRCGRQHRWRRYRESPAGPAWSENPCTCAISSCREPGDLAVARAW